MTRFVNIFETQQMIEELSLTVVTDNSGWLCRNRIFHIVLEPTFPSALYKDNAMLHALCPLRYAPGQYQLLYG